MAKNPYNWAKDKGRKGKGEFVELIFQIQRNNIGKPVKKMNVGGDFIGGGKVYEIKSYSNPKLTSAEKRLQKKKGKGYIVVTPNNIQKYTHG